MNKILTLGESLVRFSTSKGQRLMNSTTLDVNYGGAEANVAINLAILGHSVKYATKLPNENSLAIKVVNILQSFGVDCSEVLYGEGRLGNYYLEIGADLRASNVIYDRKYSTLSLMEENEWKLDELFNGVSIFHITGITLALSPAWKEIGLYLIKEAKNRGIMISFDMNYRAKMWSYEEAIPVYQKILPFVDYLSAGKLDAIHFLDIPEVDGKEDLYYLNKIVDPE